MKRISFSPFPVFTTNRLLLRQLNATDALALSILRSNERVNRYIKRVKYTSVNIAGEFIKNINENIRQNITAYWAICIKDNPEVIGAICLWNFSKDLQTAEVGYELSPAFYRQAIMSEALECIIQYSFETDNLFETFNQSHRKDFCTKQLMDLKWITVAKKLMDNENIEIHDKANANIFLFGICDVHPAFNSLVVGLLYVYT